MPHSNLALVEPLKPLEAAPSPAAPPLAAPAQDVVVLKFGSSILRNAAQAPAVASEV